MDNLDLSSNSKYSIENFFIYNIKIENSYNLSKDTPRFNIFNYNLIDEFRKDNILEINCRLLYQYTKYNNIGFYYIFLSYMMVLVQCFMNTKAFGQMLVII